MSCAFHRVAMTFCLTLASSLCQAQLGTELVASGLDRPVFLASTPADPGALFVIEQEGAIRVIRDGVLLPTPFLDIDGTVTGGDSGGDERGLLGLAFSPNYATDGKFYVNYTTTRSNQLGTVVSEFTVLDANTADPTSEREIIAFSQPFQNHNAGWIGFGPHDGLFYIFTGDGGSGNDPQNNAVNLGNLLGKILRIDVSDDSLPYTVPPSNPFVGVAGTRPEIFAYGVRNPWRGSFAPNGDLYFGDVGQQRREELNVLPAASGGGQHYGWRCREGFIANPSFSCATDPLWVDPIYDNSRPNGECSIVGGYVYNGCALGEQYRGAYFFSDYCTGRVELLDPDTNTVIGPPVLNVGFGMASFGEGADGELYLCRIFSGQVVRIVNTAGDQCPCPGDVADDFGFEGADGQVTFGDFLFALTILGPCPGSVPGCAFDIADDFGFEGADGQVGFGDFLFALTVLGPCP